ncbi:hypothetical protein Nepgr_030277 [Nepenthes gracilis]|uniref:RCHY1 zinc-ribbon domain-containing protein n=1 Tax=Nepenthes gracilis TaxID=150966 RepID=A0AAD3TFV6_NEPGR|nr:hypothetical protein Nepgr_030277 [Nepenthes gracilis]
MDEEIEATFMPEDYRYKKLWILCNDCNATTEVYFHIIGQKCGRCKSYNTRNIAPLLPPLKAAHPLSSSPPYGGVGTKRQPSPWHPPFPIANMAEAKRCKM